MISLEKHTKRMQHNISCSKSETFFTEVQKNSVRQMACHNPQSLIILYECPHDLPKENHHPDYSKWKEVWKLCSDCHRQIKSVRKKNTGKNKFSGKKCYFCGTPTLDKCNLCGRYVCYRHSCCGLKWEDRAPVEIILDNIRKIIWEQFKH